MPFSWTWKKWGQDLIQQLSPKQLHLGWRSRFTIHIISITLSLCLPQQPGRSRFRHEKKKTLPTVWSGWVTFIHLCWRSNSRSRSLNSSFSSGRHWKFNVVICCSMLRCIGEKNWRPCQSGDGEPSCLLPLSQSCESCVLHTYDVELFLFSEDKSRNGHGKHFFAKKHEEGWQLSAKKNKTQTWCLNQLMPTTPSITPITIAPIPKRANSVGV